MTVNFDLNLKKTLSITLLIGNLFAIFAAGDYVYWRYKANSTFAIMEFDLNSRMPEIQAKYEAIVKANQERAQKASASAVGATSTVAITTTTSTLPTKK